MQIHAPEIAAAIRDYFGVRGQAVLDSLAPEIVPIAIVADLLQPRGAGHLAAGATQRLAAAANYAHILLYNPPGNNADLELEYFAVSTGGNDYFQLGTFQDTTGSLTSWTVQTANTRFLDIGHDGKPSGLLATRNHTAALGVVPLWFGRCLATQALQIDGVRAVLRPTWGVVVNNSTANSDLTVSYAWKERAR